MVTDTGDVAYRGNNPQNSLSFTDIKTPDQ